MKYSIKTLPEIIAQIVNFSQNDYDTDGKGSGVENMPDDLTWNVAYIVACFVAQHTGYECEHSQALNGLRITEFMSYAERVELAKEFLKQFDK